MASKLEILLVEDSPSDAELTIRVFRRESVAATVHVVTDGAQALDFAFAEGSFTHRRAEAPLRVIFLDLNLPRIGGLSVMQSLKTDARTEHIPIVALTGSDADKDILKSYALGVSHYLVKPLDGRKLVSVLRDLGLLEARRTGPQVAGGRGEVMRSGG